MKEVLLKQMQFSWQADLLEDELKKNLYKVRRVEKPREYTSILLGGSNQIIEFYIDELHFKNATEFIEKLDRETAILSKDNVVSIPNEAKLFQRNFKQFLFLNLISVVLFPIIFNTAATIRYKQIYADLKLNKKTELAFFVLILSWLIALAEVKYLVFN